MMKKKLLFIVNVDWAFIVFRLPIAIRAMEDGYEVHLACAITSKRLELEELGIIIHPLTLSRSGTVIFSELKAVYQIYLTIKNLSPDIVHSVTIKPVLYGTLVARLLSVPKRVVSISGLGYVFIAEGLKANLLRFFIGLFYKSALTKADSVIFQNSSDRDILKKLNAVKSHQEVFIKGSGVDLNLFNLSSEPSGQPVVMLVARLLIDKGVREFIESAKLIRATHPDVRMVLVGDVDAGNPKSLTPEELTTWTDNKTVEHWGYSNDVSTTMSKANLIVLPSYREGLPKSLIEAAACGRAVVTTDVPGCRDAIINDVTGLLVPSKDAQALAGAIVCLVDNAELRQYLARNGRAFAEKTFDIRDVVAKHLDIYSD